jgi:4-amino-4-deoxy-L-arabinose transferase-like glycosyltransferase
VKITSIKKWQSGGAIFILVGILSAGLFFRLCFISRTMPYPLHPDEAFLSQSAQQMLTTGDDNPHFFNYPSLPIYLTRACMALGFYVARWRGEIVLLDQISSVGYPYYQPATIMWPARILFVLFSVVTLLCVAFIDRCNTGARSSLWVSALLLSFSGQFLFHSWRYLNVDIVGLCFVCIGIWHLLATLREKSIRHRAVIPGVLCGLAAACKYPLILLALPYLLAILLCRRRQFVLMSFYLFAITIITFVALVPYSVLDAPAFWHGLRYEMIHYRSGHPGFEGQAGFAQFLFYMRMLVAEFGAVAFIYAVTGIFVMAWFNWKKTIILLSFPLALLLLMSFQRVHFLRNMLILFALWPVFISLAMHRLRYRILQLLNRIDVKATLLGGNWKRAAAFAIVTAPLAITLPWHSIARAYNVPTDSRKAVVQWIRKHIAIDSDLVVAAELQMDIRNLQPDYLIHQVAFEDSAAVDSVITLIQGRSKMFILVPEFAPNPRRSGEEEYAQRLNARWADFHSIEQFGREAVRVKNIDPSGSGNPRFSICRKIVP